MKFRNKRVERLLVGVVCHGERGSIGPKVAGAGGADTVFTD